MKRRLIDSLALRLLLTTIVVLGLCVAVISTTVSYLINAHPGLLYDHELDEEADALAASVRFDATGRPVRIVPPPGIEWIFAELPNDIKYRVVDARGQVLLSSEPGGQALVPAGAAFDPTRTTFGITAGGHPMTVRVNPIGATKGHYLLQTAGSTRLGDFLRRGFILQAIKALKFNLGVAALIFTFVLLHMFRRALKPLRRASRETERITPRNLGARLSLHDMPSELRPLIESFNQTLARLETGFQVQQVFLAAAAHELKTPLTMLRAQIELEDALEDKLTLLREVDLMARHVQQLLQLAELSEIQNYQFSPTSLAAVARETVDYLRRRADTAAVEVEFADDGAGPMVLADAGALFVLFKNILENAILHAPAGGRVSVRIDAGRVRIADDGPGIRPEHLAHVFTRFWRAPGSRYDGAGLGLAICREIAQAHGWRLLADNSGHGAVFSLYY